MEKLTRFLSEKCTSLINPRLERLPVSDSYLEFRVAANQCLFYCRADGRLHVLSRWFHADDYEKIVGPFEVLYPIDGEASSLVRGMYLTLSRELLDQMVFPEDFEPTGINGFFLRSAYDLQGVWGMFHACWFVSPFMGHKLVREKFPENHWEKKAQREYLNALREVVKHLPEKRLDLS